MVVKFLGKKTKIEISGENINYVTRLGRRRGERPILIKFTTFAKKLEVWENKRNLIGTKIRVDEDCNRFPFPALVGTLVVSCSYSYYIIIVWFYVLVVLMLLVPIFPQ
jgi:hypothetical protein